MKLQELRKKYPQFIYENYSYRIIKKDLEIFFNFRISSDIFFKPKIIIKNIDKKGLSSAGDKTLNNLIFHLGLIEMISYWKSFCSPEIIIKAGYLDKEQIKWWKDLIIKGMGQFFYENKIDWRPLNFLKISARKDVPVSDIARPTLRDRYLAPFSGGRDSILTLEKLKKQKKEIALFLVNPIKQIQKTAKVSRIKKQIIIERSIDRKLLELNKKGYLNGHTPFTALLSFLSVLCASLFDYKNIVFSNEKSANEGNVKYLGKVINHQWSKSSEFEKKFKSYCEKYLVKDINYSSYLRKYGELEISKMLTQYPQYFSVFSSCNAGMRIGAKQIRWCGNCPKCLFVYATLYPYFEKKQLLKIFGKDLFENKKLLAAAKALIGKGKFKPFECIGTYKESRLAFNLCLKKAKKLGKIPYLLIKFDEVK